MIEETRGPVLEYGAKPRRREGWLRGLLVGLMVTAGLAALGFLWGGWSDMIACNADPPYLDVKFGGVLTYLRLKQYQIVVRPYDWEVHWDGLVGNAGLTAGVVIGMIFGLRWVCRATPASDTGR